MKIYSVLLLLLVSSQVLAKDDVDFSCVTMFSGYVEEAYSKGFQTPVFSEKEDKRILDYMKVWNSNDKKIDTLAKDYIPFAMPLFKEKFSDEYVICKTYMKLVEEHCGKKEAEELKACHAEIHVRPDVKALRESIMRGMVAKFRNKIEPPKEKWDRKLILYMMDRPVHFTLIVLGVMATFYGFVLLILFLVFKKTNLFKPSSKKENHPFDE